MCEYAWTNLDGTAKEWVGMSNEKIDCTLHRSQKHYTIGYLADMQSAV